MDLSRHLGHGTSNLIEQSNHLVLNNERLYAYHSDDLILIGYTDSDFQSYLNFKKSTSGSVFTLGSGAISWRNVKQSCIVDSTMEAEYVVAYAAAKRKLFGSRNSFLILVL